MLMLHDKSAMEAAAALNTCYSALGGVPSGGAGSAGLVSFTSSPALIPTPPHAGSSHL